MPEGKPREGQAQPPLSSPGFTARDRDQQSAIELAEQSCADIKAPVFVRFEGCHHFVAMNRPELFLRELLARVRPVL